jgi:sugar phosphate isomerase/epimerase
MRLDQVAAITYSVSSHCQDAAGLEQSLRRIREIGYTAVQISGIGPVPEEEIVRICAGLDLTICATHEPAERIIKDTASVISRLRQLHCRITAYPHPHVPLDGVAAVEQWAADLDRAGAAMAAEGMTLLYHNHDLEFVHVEGRRILDRLYEATDPAHLGGEPDTYWIQRGGGEPSGWCRRLRGRMPVLHMKDYRLNGAREPEMCAIGAGNLDWPRIVSAAEEAGCQWYVVEHDHGTFESLADSFTYIRDTLCR